MFEQFLSRSYALAHHRDRPLAEARLRYLCHCAQQGMTKSTISVLASYLLIVTKCLQLEKRGNDVIQLTEIESAAARWSKRRRRPAKMLGPENTYRRFLRVAKNWLLFLGRLQLPPAANHMYTDRITAFSEFQKEKNFADITIRFRSRVVQVFLDRLCGARRHLEDITPVHVDEALSERACEGGLRRKSIRNYAETLRTFFRYAEKQGWCRKGLADDIILPRVYAQESIPAGPPWKDVQRLLATTKGDRPADIRDRALLMLLIVYGFRGGEVRQLRLDDLNWEQELVRVKRTKQGRTQSFPLSRSVGDAILRYLKEVRPRSSHREVFLKLNAPIRPMGDAALRQAIAHRLRSLNIVLPHYGPHALRHACATHLLAEGHNLKEIGDYLGHVCPDSTRIYAKVNLNALRVVGDLDLEGLS